MQAVVLVPSHNVTENRSIDYADLIVRVQARIVSAAWARRKANGWLVMNVGERVSAGIPELVLDDPLVWRVPLRWTSSTRGVLAGHIGELCVDAITGEILGEKDKIREICDSVEHSARTLQSSIN
jgi:hypothetical protein